LKRQQTSFKQSVKKVSKNMITATEALKFVKDHVQWCRENGESDMRSVLGYINMLEKQISDSKTVEEITEYFES
jgi:hypothetical protein